MKLRVKSDEEVMTEDVDTEFTTFEIHHVDSILASKRFISDVDSKRRYSDELFSFIDESYDSLGGFRSFRDMDRFINDSYFWYITYAGHRPVSETELDVNRIYVVSVYRQSHGMKLVGLARRNIRNSESSREDNINVRRDANSAVIQHIRFMNKIGWAEVSHGLEIFFNRAFNTRDIIDPYELKEQGIFPDIQICEDELHYTRMLRKGGPEITKIAYGKINW